MFNLCIGFDTREAEVYEVARFSALRHASIALNIIPIKLAQLQESGLYQRKTSRKDGLLFDEISQAPMSTEFAITRFFMQYLNLSGECAIFTDCDFLFRCDLAEVFALFDKTKAVQCVHHVHQPKETIKMDNQAQLLYARKNWSSMMIWNLRHHANQKLDLVALNSLPGRDFHRFYWLNDDEIGALPMTYNWLEGSYDKALNPKIIHYTRGGPWFANYQKVDFAEEWRAEYQLWQASQSADLPNTTR